MKPLREESSVKDMDEGSKVTHGGERGLDAIRRQLDAEYAVSSKSATPSHGKNKVRMVILGLLLGCIVGGAAVALAMLTYGKQADVPTAAPREPSAPRPVTATPRAPVLAPAPSSSESKAITASETPSAADIGATDQSSPRGHDVRQPGSATSSTRVIREGARTPSQRSQRAPRPVEAP